MSTSFRRGLIVAVVLTVFGAVFRAGAQAGGNSVTINFGFQSLEQGRAGLITVAGTDVVAGAVDALSHHFPCITAATGGLQCLVAAPYDQVPGAYPLTLTLARKGQSALIKQGSVTVSAGGFLAEALVLPSRLGYLLHPDVEADENDRLLTAYSIVTPVKYWEGAFKPPISGPLSSGFGNIRSYPGYGDVITRHTGQDFTAPIGTSVMASANGRVVLSRLMNVHGNNIVIDHGWGVYTEYAHLSQRFVVPGQFVLQGQIIGLSGNTGRSTGPHVHWEVAINDIWVNPLDFLNLSLTP